MGESAVCTAPSPHPDMGVSPRPQGRTAHRESPEDKSAFSPQVPAEDDSTDPLGPPLAPPAPRFRDPNAEGLKLRPAQAARKHSRGLCPHPRPSPGPRFTTADQLPFTCPVFRAHTRLFAQSLPLSPQLGDRLRAVG